MRTTSLRPLRDLLGVLPGLPVSDGKRIDCIAIEPVLRHRIAADATTTATVIHNGLGALGHLLAHSADVIEDGTIGADSLESLGYLIAELGDLASVCLRLAADCRRAA